MKWLPSLESEEKKQTRNTIVAAGLIAEPTEPTGDGYALTCVNPLPTTL